MLVVLTETYCNKVNIQVTEQDDFIQISSPYVTHLYLQLKSSWTKFD